jgi:hypothetical protein
LEPQRETPRTLIVIDGFALRGYLTLQTGDSAPGPEDSDGMEAADAACNSELHDARQFEL